MRGLALILLLAALAFRHPLGRVVREIGSMASSAVELGGCFFQALAQWVEGILCGKARWDDCLTLEGLAFFAFVGIVAGMLIGGLVLFLSRRVAGMRGAKGYDEPVDDFSDDRLGRRAYADMLVKEIRKAPRGSSQVIGVYGRWGEGKTSLVKMTERRVKSKGGCGLRFVWFYPWASVDRQEINAELFKCMGRKLFGWRSPFLAMQLVRYSCQQTVGWLPRPHGLVEIVVWILAETMNLFSSLDAVKRKLRQKLRRLDARVVVVIDDLDRLEKDEVRAVARCVKTNGDLPNVTYLLLTEEARFAKMLAPIYGDEESGSAEEGARFLEKIVPQPLPLWPVPEVLVVNEAERLVRAAVRDAELPASEIAREDVEFCCRKFKNLRQVKCLARTFASALSYYQASAANRGALDLHLGDALRLTALRLVQPEAVNRLFLAYGQLLETSAALGYGIGLEMSDADYQALVSSAEDEHRKWFAEFLDKTMAIRLKTVNGKSCYLPYGVRERTMTTSFRLASPAHFARYFNAFELPKVVLPRERLEEFVTALKQPESMDDWIGRTQATLSVSAFLEYFSTWDYSVTDFSLLELVRGLDRIVAGSAALEPAGDLRRCRLMAAVQWLVARHLDRMKLEPQAPGAQDCAAIVDYLIGQRSYVLTEFLILATCGQVEPKLTADALKFDEPELRRLWAWLKQELDGRVFEPQIEDLPESEFIARFYHVIVFNLCAADGELSRNHVNYLKRKLKFPQLIGRLKTLARYERGGGLVEERLSFGGAYGMASPQAYLEILSSVEDELSAHFDWVKDEDLPLIRLAVSGFATSASERLSELMAARQRLLP